MKEDILQTASNSTTVRALEEAEMRAFREKEAVVENAFRERSWCGTLDDSEGWSDTDFNKSYVSSRKKTSSSSESVLGPDKSSSESALSDDASDSENFGSSEIDPTIYPGFVRKAAPKIQRGDWYWTLVAEPYVWRAMLFTTTIDKVVMSSLFTLLSMVIGKFLLG